MTRLRQSAFSFLWLLLVIPILTARSDPPTNPPPAPTFLTSGALDIWPCFSPDGTLVLFSRRDIDTWRLLLVSADGGTPHPLARTPLAVAATRANWSAQRNLIAFTGTSKSGQNTIWLINGDGTNPHELNLSGLSDQMFYPSWFPNGEQLAAMDGQDLVTQRVDLRTGIVSTLTNPQNVLTGMPNVSPDGKSIAFAGQQFHGQKYDQTQNIIWILDETGVPRPLEANPAQGRAPTWSPDAKRLAFESNRGDPEGAYSIFIINRDGTGLTQFTDRKLNANHPVWSPDGTQLAFDARASIWTNERSIAVTKAVQ
jgi:Tol biopolymer transport system component